MPKLNDQKDTPVYKDFAGGLNIRDAAHVIKDNECTEAQNVYFNAEGGVQKRGGWSKLDSDAVGTAGNLKGMVQAVWVISSAINRKLVVTDGVKFFWLNGGTWADITGAVTWTTSTAIPQVSFISFNNSLIGYDGTNAPVKWDGSVAAVLSLGGTPPVGTMAIVWQNRLWWAGVAAAQTRLYYSNLGDPEVYGASAYIDVPSPFDGEEITGLAVLYGNLIIFKRYSIYILQGDSPDNWVLSKTNSSVGCVSPFSVVNIGNLIYFVSDKGLYAMNLTNNRQLCYKVEPRYNASVANHIDTGNVLNKLQAMHYKKRNQLWMLMDASTAGQNTHDRILIHDYVVVDENGDPATSEYVVATAKVLTVTISAAGTGYTAADVLTLVGGDQTATVTVSTVDGSGKVTGVTVSAAGSGFTAAAVYATTGGTGSGCIITVATVSTGVTAPQVLCEYISPSTGEIQPIATFYDKYVYVYQEATTTDTLADDTLVAKIVKYTTKYFDFGDPFAYKMVRWFWSNVNITSGTVTTQMIVTKSDDIGLSSTTMTITPTVAFPFWNIRTNFPYSATFGQVLGRFLKFSFKSISTGSFVLYAYGFSIIAKGRRQ